MRMLLGWLACLAAPLAAQAPASLDVVRPDGSTRTLTLEALRALPAQALTLPTHDGPITLRGPTVAAVLRAAGAVPEGPVRGPLLARSVIAEARDGYRVAFGLAEFDSSLVTPSPIVALEQGGAPLDERDGPLRLAVPGSTHGARSARQLVRLLVTVPAGARPLPGVGTGPGSAAPVPVWLVRHGEKAAAPADDPGLTPAGKRRAQDVVFALTGNPIRLLLTSDTRRTRETAAPIARKLRLDPVAVPVAADVGRHAAAVAALARAALPGTAVLVVGHTNTLGLIAAELGVPLPRWCDDEYDRLVRLDPDGQGGMRATTLHFGTRTPVGECGGPAPPMAGTPAARPAALPDEGPAILAAIDSLFLGMARRDVALSRRLLLPGAQFVATAAGDSTRPPRVQGDTAFLRSLASDTTALLERIWAPELRVTGPLATVWAPYDFHRGGAFSHCGTDAFQLLRTPDGWRVGTIAYTVQRSGCAPSPLGPPR
ncbi:MAG: histidine phosphatase family protein [Gemmatimonadales bacterium]|nr:histidine phosphatase family protein [Gemmatimonadales bacterium]